MMVRAPPAYCGGRSVTPKTITVATAARAGSRVLVTANSVGVIRLRLASDRLKATAVAATATIPVRPATTRGSPDGCAVHGETTPAWGWPPCSGPRRSPAGHRCRGPPRSGA
jgi:hypothetical protein